MSQKIKVNETIVNTYSYLKGNFSEDNFIVDSHGDLNIKIDKVDAVVDFNEGIKDRIESLACKINSGVNSLIVENLIKGKFINIKSQGESRVSMKSEVNNVSTATFNIECNDGEDIYVENEIIGDGEQFNYFYYINSKKNSKVTLVIFTNSSSKGFINILGECENEGNIDILFINVNKNNVYTNCELYLNGVKSLGNIEVCYICSKDYKFDYNVTTALVGEESNSEIIGKGILLDKSQKVFRGTIDFKKGCINASGDESEEVIILSKNAKNQSLPFLLCKEKNVKGSHGFTANSINEDKLFYLLSRGFNEREAKGLILKGKFLGILNRINNQEFIDKFIEVLMGAI